jgi:hypothetical protein
VIQLNEKEKEKLAIAISMMIESVFRLTDDLMWLRVFYYIS